MAVAFDAATDAQEVGGDGVLSLAHTPVGSTNLAAFAASGNGDGGGGSLGSMTYDGVSMTELWDAVSGLQGHGGYALAGIPTGAKTVTNTLVNTGPSEHTLGVMTMTGVDQTTPVGMAVSSIGSTGTASNTVASVAADDLVVDSLYVEATVSIVIGANQTQRNAETVGTFYSFRQSTQPGTAGGVMSWTFEIEGNWFHGAVAFKTAAAAATLPQDNSQAHGLPVVVPVLVIAMPPSTALASGLLTSAPPFFTTVDAKRTN